jgi:hypothetical protein
MSVSPFKPFLIVLFIFVITITAFAQDTTFRSKHAAIFFPYPMYQEKWRSSLGFTFLTTPEDITEEVRLRIPCGDFRVLRKITRNFALDGRIAFQFLQNHLSAGIVYMKPISSRFYLSAGDDMAYWFGFLKLGGFDSKASGWMNYPNASLGYKSGKNLLITLKAEVAVNLYYQAANGENKFSSGRKYYNGETFTLALEQPFYNRTHLTLAFSAISNYFYWQTWSLFYKTNRKVFYPQITVEFIL